MSAEPRTSGGDSTTSAPALLLYGEEHTNLALADELALDGYEVHRASDPAVLHAACDTREIALVIFGRQPTVAPVLTCCADCARGSSCPRSIRGRARYG